jgi:hypothetical protein
MTATARKAGSKTDYMLRFITFRQQPGRKPSVTTLTAFCFTLSKSSWYFARLPGPDSLIFIYFP